MSRTGGTAALVGAAEDVLTGASSAVDGATAADDGAALDVGDDNTCDDNACDDDAGATASETAPPTINAAIPAPAAAHTIRRLMPDHPRTPCRHSDTCGCLDRAQP